ncbi:MAG: hypothetical protein ACLPHI_01745 [Terriglobales bacterium]|jgi:hypothetical protein
MAAIVPEMRQVSARRLERKGEKVEIQAQNGKSQSGTRRAKFALSFAKPEGQILPGILKRKALERKTFGEENMDAVPYLLATMWGVSWR